MIGEQRGMDEGGNSKLKKTNQHDEVLAEGEDYEFQWGPICMVV